MKKVLMFVLFCSFVSVGFAQDAAPKAEKSEVKKHKRPAVDACVDKKENDACSFTNVKGVEKEGTCKELKLKTKTELVCRPQGKKKAEAAAAAVTK